MRTSKGFTIIELLVVVSIIAVLAAIVLVNVTGYINRGKNASIKSNLATVATNGSIFFYNNSTYDAFCTNAYFTSPSAAITAAGGTAICTEKGDNTTYDAFCTNAYFTSPSAAITAAGGTAICTEKGDNTTWCACSTMKVTTAEPANSTFCVDSTGYKKVTQNVGLCATRCPAAGACVD